MGQEPCWLSHHPAVSADGWSSHPQRGRTRRNAGQATDLGSHTAQGSKDLVTDGQDHSQSASES